MLIRKFRLEVDHIVSPKREPGHSSKLDRDGDGVACKT
ncbi:excalibur calcium-binding domain-containing protein [Paenibacillus chitinolyticus]|nr:excalibur calcium-binding domain-containing protein [Paenibacillus chitinolyticus]